MPWEGKRALPDLCSMLHTLWTFLFIYLDPASLASLRVPQTLQAYFFLRAFYMSYFSCLRNVSSKYGLAHHLTSFSCAQICSWDFPGGPVVIHRLTLGAPHTRDPSSIPGQGTISHMLRLIYIIYIYTHTHTHTHTHTPCVCVYIYININCLCGPSRISAPWRVVSFAHGVSRVSRIAPGKIGGAQLIFLFFFGHACGMQDLSNQGLNLGPLNCGILTTGPPEKSPDK